MRLQPLCLGSLSGAGAVKTGTKMRQGTGSIETTSVIHAQVEYPFRITRFRGRMKKRREIDEREAKGE